MFADHPKLSRLEVHVTSDINKITIHQQICTEYVPSTEVWLAPTNDTDASRQVKACYIQNRWKMSVDVTQWAVREGGSEGRRKGTHCRHGCVLR